eukprot:TRINITY_DN72620_c0_g1_i1.p1 TRINITY_DN72620_c0_g1~~TRINITY_DN72620_c0_g1_i1.p1  ORF type:complete len:333 (-),score=39.40 TRINITY_DN72620_c0_g1_i1:71-1069(-)
MLSNSRTLRALGAFAMARASVVLILAMTASPCLSSEEVLTTFASRSPWHPKLRRVVLADGTSELQLKSPPSDIEIMPPVFLQVNADPSCNCDSSSTIHDSRVAAEMIAPPAAKVAPAAVSSQPLSAETAFQSAEPVATTNTALSALRMELMQESQRTERAMQESLQHQEAQELAMIRSAVQQDEQQVFGIVQQLQSQVLQLSAALQHPAQPASYQQSALFSAPVIQRNVNAPFVPVPGSQGWTFQPQQAAIEQPWPREVVSSAVVPQAASFWQPALASSALLTNAQSSTPQSALASQGSTQFLQQANQPSEPVFQPSAAYPMLYRMQQVFSR